MESNFLRLCRIKLSKQSVRVNRRFFHCWKCMLICVAASLIACSEKKSAQLFQFTINVDSSYLASAHFELSNIKLINASGEASTVIKEGVNIEWHTGEENAKHIINNFLPDQGYSEISFELTIKSLTYLKAYHLGEHTLIDSLHRKVPDEKSRFSFHSNLTQTKKTHTNVKQLDIVFDADRSVIPLFKKENTVTSLFKPVFLINKNPQISSSNTIDANAIILADAKNRPLLSGAFTETYKQAMLDNKLPTQFFSPEGEPLSTTIDQLLFGQRLFATVGHGSINFRLLEGRLVGRIKSTLPLVVLPLIYNQSPLTHRQSLAVKLDSNSFDKFSPTQGQLINIKGFSLAEEFYASNIQLIDESQVTYKMVLPLSLSARPIHQLTSEVLQFDPVALKDIHQVIQMQGLVINDKQIESINIQDAEIAIYTDRIVDGNRLQQYEDFSKVKNELGSLLLNAGHLNEIHAKGQLIDKTLFAQSLTFVVYGSSILDSLYSTELEEEYKDKNPTLNDDSNALPDPSSVILAASLAAGLPLTTIAIYLIYKNTRRDNAGKSVSSFIAPDSPTANNDSEYNQWYLKEYSDLIKKNPDGYFTLNGIEIDTLIQTNKMIELQTMVDYLNAYNINNGDILFQALNAEKKIDTPKSLIVGIDEYQQNIFLLPRHLQYYPQEAAQLSQADSENYHRELADWKKAQTTQKRKDIASFLKDFQQSNKHYAIMPALINQHFNSVIFIKNADGQSITPIIVEPFNGEPNVPKPTAQQIIDLLPDNITAEYPFDLQKHLKVINTGIQNDGCSCGPISALGATAIVEQMRKQGVNTQALTPLVLDDIKKQIKAMPIFEPTPGHPRVRHQMIKAFDFTNQIDSELPSKRKAIKYP